MSSDFWNKTWETFKPVKIDPTNFRMSGGPGRKLLLELAGNLNNKQILDIGCGNGMLSTFLALSGAKVTSIDTSDVSIKNTMEMAKYNKVESSVTARNFDALKINELSEGFDLVIGEFILHHIEPFDRFTDALTNSLKNGGKAVFLENNIRNPILKYCRKYLSGRFGIKKYGDAVESPFEPSELKILQSRFNQVNIYYPEFMFFQLFNSHVFRKIRLVEVFFGQMDSFVFKYLPFLNKYSYRQVIAIVK